MVNVKNAEAKTATETSLKSILKPKRKTSISSLLDSAETQQSANNQGQDEPSLEELKAPVPTKSAPPDIKDRRRTPKDGERRLKTPITSRAAKMVKGSTSLKLSGKERAATPGKLYAPGHDTDKISDSSPPPPDVHHGQPLTSLQNLEKDQVIAPSSSKGIKPKQSFAVTRRVRSRKSDRKFPKSFSSFEQVQQQYRKEIETIANILKSVTEANESLEDVHQSSSLVLKRSLSTKELHQLITSVERVASLHHYLPRGSDVAEKITSIMRKGSETSDQMTIADEPTDKMDNTSETPNNKKGKSKKRSRKTDSNKTLHKTRISKLAAESSRRLSKAKPSITFSNKAKNDSSGAKDDKKGRRSRSNNPDKGQKVKDKQRKSSADSLQSDLSELDLVKSAILNKRFYDEAIALERMGSKENVKSELASLSGAFRTHSGRGARIS